ncbi:hypothetical protein [Parvicella tangerina]|uniref:Lipoprotein n=1 Tax=Parvicella tangerina TaxID=2829795 RepID=A0A916N9F9_9FLAO|nr:hypothetical protein [Parvicella tangerina]CAG5078869.1 hypothetical protein CRYO30217_00792 [Parvicella tangerina]
MKKVVLSLGVIATLAMTSCGGPSAADVNVDEIEDACGCADAFVAIGGEILDVVGDKTEDEAEEDEEMKKQLEPLFEKLEKAEDKCRGELEVSMDDMKECNAEVEEVAKKFEEKF